MDILLVSFSKFLLKLSFFELLTDECSKNSRNLWIDEKKKDNREMSDCNKVILAPNN